MVSSQLCRAFTLIEVIMVVLVISILASMIMGAWAVFGGDHPDTRTRAIIGTVHAAVASRSSELGTAEVFAVHPLANQAAFANTGLQRSRFHRPGGGLVAISGEAYVTPVMAWAPAADRVLEPDDHFGGITSDGDLPGLYGVQRRQMTIPGAALGLSEHRTLAGPAGEPGGHDDPRKHLYMRRDRGDLTDPVLAEEQSRTAFEFLFSPVAQELKRIGGVAEAVDGDGSILAFNNRLRLYTGAEDVHARWKPGTVKATVSGATRWYRYRIRGLSLVDGWGRELLCFAQPDGTAFASAGKDGVFAVHPGSPANYDTQPWARPAASTDDRDGRSDNRVEGGAWDVE